MAARKTQTPGTIQRSFKPSLREGMTVAFPGRTWPFDFLLIHFTERVGVTPIKTQIRRFVPFDQGKGNRRVGADQMCRDGFHERALKRQAATNAKGK
jgi:hypothetical protein